MIQHTKVEVFRRQIPTVFGIRIKRVSNAVRDDVLTIVAGIGQHSQTYEDPYNISQSGRKYFDNYEFYYKIRFRSKQSVSFSILPYVLY